MRNYINTLFCLIVCLFVGACSNDEMELNKGENELLLNATTTDVVLDISKATSEVLTFNWTSGSNKGTGTAISYTFQIDIAGNNFAGGVVEYMGKSTYSISYTNDQLTELLSEELGLSYGVEANLEARVTAKVADESVEDQVSETFFFKATPYKPLTKKLYLIGDATPTGWNADEPTEMNAIAGVIGGFTWQGVLKKNGKFKFITTLGQFIPSYNYDPTQETNLMYREEETQPDEQFAVAETGNYSVTVNLLNKTIEIIKLAGEIGPKYDMLYFVGSFTGWSFVPMKQDVLNNFLFRYGAVFDWTDGGDFKFGTTSGSWDDMYHPLTESAAYTESAMEQTNAQDYKWFLPQDLCGKAYKLVVDITMGKEKMLMQPFTPYATIYMIGDATAAGWDIGNAVEMTTDANNPFLSTWEGQLNPGALKFTCDKKSDLSGAWFMPTAGDAVPTGEEEPMLYLDKSDAEFKAQYGDVSIGDVDMKWKITTAGIYSITLNQLTETIVLKSK
ncbi:MAG: SusF/SusE family outer membrane protein [Bacteroidaceae bacterium]|nr:SusF/SusE family outer membrane protein [Bacteroidaceae bacterium]